MESPVNWPLSRTWSLTAPNAEPKRVGTSELSEVRALSLRGAAGLGKTFEMNAMIAADRLSGRDVRSARLAGVAHDLSAGLDAVIRGATSDTVVYLDALDEAMVAPKSLALPLASWIRTSLAPVRPRLRISCRGAVWPSVLTAAMHEAYGEADCCVAELEPMSDGDIVLAAEAEGVSSGAFMAAVRGTTASTLARHPITLGMMLRLFKSDGALTPVSSSETRT